jgi:putative Mg2+ transporter-C (MgtC) family protein
MPISLDLGGQLEGLVRIALAAVAGGVIGFDRARQDKPADVRTFALVATGSAAFTLVGLLAFGEGEPGSRVAAQIVTGIGFLGAGTIIHYRDDVIGLTTAAAIWSVAAVGMAIGSGLYLLGIAGAGVILLLLRWHGLERTAKEQPPDDDG